MGLIVMALDTALPFVALLAAIALHRHVASAATVGMLVGAGIMCAIATMRPVALGLGVALVPAPDSAGWTLMHYAVTSSYLLAIVGEAVFLVSLLRFAWGLGKAGSKLSA